jgi:hypothetical protein
MYIFSDHPRSLPAVTKILGQQNKIIDDPSSLDIGGHPSRMGDDQSGIMLVL